MMQEHTIEEMEWQAKRMGRFTASEIHKLIPVSAGRNANKSLLQIDGAMTYIRTKAAERLTMEVKEVIDFKQASWGKEYEAEAVAAFERTTGKKGNHYGVINPTFFEYGEYAGCSPDYEIPSVEGADIKAPYNTSEHITNLLLQSADDFKKERWDYYCQCQMSMHIRGWKRFYFVSYDPRMVEHKYRLKILVIYPDEVWVAEFQSRLNEAILTLEAMLVNLDYVLSNKTAVA